MFDLSGGIIGGVAMVDMLSTLLCETSGICFDIAELSIVDPRLLGSFSFTKLRTLFSRLAPSVPFFNSDCSFRLRSIFGGLSDGLVFAPFVFGVEGVDTD